MGSHMLYRYFFPIPRNFWFTGFSVLLFSWILSDVLLFHSSFIVLLLNTRIDHRPIKRAFMILVNVYGPRRRWPHPHRYHSIAQVGKEVTACNTNLPNPETFLLVTSGKFTSHPSSLPANLPIILCVLALHSGVKFVLCFAAICAINASEPSCFALGRPSAVQNRQP